MAETRTALASDDGDSYTRLGVQEAEFFANGGLDIILANRGISREVMGRTRQRLAPDLGFITLRRSMPPIQ